MKTPLPARLLLTAFISVFALAAVYLLFDTFGLWERISPTVTKGLAVVTGLILFAALIGHLLLATGSLPPPDRPDLGTSAG